MQQCPERCPHGVELPERTEKAPFEGLASFIT